MKEDYEDEWIQSTDDGDFMTYRKENQRFNTKYLLIPNIIIKFATKIIINF